MPQTTFFGPRSCSTSRSTQRRVSVLASLRLTFFFVCFRLLHCFLCSFWSANDPRRDFDGFRPTFLSEARMRVLPPGLSLWDHFTRPLKRHIGTKRLCADLRHLDCFFRQAYTPGFGIIIAPGRRRVFSAFALDYYARRAYAQTIRFDVIKVIYPLIHIFPRAEHQLPRSRTSCATIRFYISICLLALYYGRVKAYI